MSNLKITLTRGLAGKRKDQKDVCASLGLTKTNQTKTHPNNEATKGKIAKVAHLVKVEEI